MVVANACDRGNLTKCGSMKNYKVSFDGGLEYY